MHRLLLGLLLFLFLAGSQALAVEETPSTAEPYPGLSEVIPRATRLSDQVSAARQQLKPMAEIAPETARLKEQQERYQNLKKRLAGYGPIEGWYFERQLEVSAQLKSLESNLADLQEQISNQLKQIDRLRSDLQNKRNYWQAWRKELESNAIDLPLDIFQRVQEQIAATLKLAEQNSLPLVSLQQQVLQLDQEVQEQIEGLETAFTDLRKNLLLRGGHSLLSAAYWSQFTPQLWQTALQEARHNLQLRDEFYAQNSLLIFLQLLFAATVAYLIHRHRATIAQSSRWQIVADNALATGVFAAVAFLSVFYQVLPPVFRLLLTSIGLLSAVQLSIGLLKSRAFSVYLYGFSLAALLTLALRLAGLPLPYYRLYLFLLNLALLANLFLLYRQLEAAGRTKRLWLLRLLFGLLVASLITNLAGYVALSFLLLESTIESVLVILFAALAYQIGLGGLTFLLHQFVAGRSQVATRYGLDFQRRFERILWLLLFGYSCLYLTAVWGLFSSPGQAWETLAGYSWQIANYQLSPAVILRVVLVFYLSLELSWFLQIILDRQLFIRRQFDRGIRDAVKKLLHYTLVLIGFLLAAGAAGFQLQNFMVLAGAFGIGIGFGLQDIVNNFISGIILLFERPIKVGDGILVDSDYGTVRQIGLRSTVIETLDQSELIVPNSQIISQKVTNWTLSTRRVRVVLPVGVAYGSQLELVMSILMEAAEQHTEVLSEPKPSPIFVEFGESSLNFELRVWISDVDKRPRVRSELLLAIDQRFREAGVEIPFPQRDLHLRSVSAGIIPVQQEAASVDKADS